MKFVGQLLSQHLQRYPEMTLADIYKLLHQAALGPAHAVQGLQARSKLESELAATPESFAEPVVDVISPDGRLARIHLREYARAGGDLETLANAFVRTASHYTGSMEKLQKFCACLGDLADAGGIPFPRTDVETFMREQASAGYPVLRHSKVFHEQYHPAYRVVDVQELPAPFAPATGK